MLHRLFFWFFFWGNCFLFFVFGFFSSGFGAEGGVRCRFGRANVYESS